MDFDISATMERLSDIAHHNDWLDGLCIRIRQELGTDMRDSRKKKASLCLVLYIFSFSSFLHVTCTLQERLVYSPWKAWVFVTIETLN